MKKKILLIDDEINILEALAFILRDVAYDVTTSPNGGIISKILLTESLDLIIMDAMLATENGIEITRMLKKNKTTEKIPIIVISANADFEGEALEAGACSFLSKPFGVGIFLDAVEKALV